jgi:hypothetical protein
MAEDLAERLQAWLLNPNGGDSAIVGLASRDMKLFLCVARGADAVRARQPDKRVTFMFEELYTLAKGFEQKTEQAARVLLHLEGKGNVCDLTNLKTAALGILSRLHSRASLFRPRTLSLIR